MTDSHKLKACADCIHCKGVDTFLSCHHPDYSYQTKDYIQGVIYTNYRLCVMVRDNEKLCGDSARGWQENPLKEPEYFPDLWAAFKDMVKTFLS
jgi:hypothetical protein